MYGISRLVLLVYLESQFKPINRLLIGTLQQLTDIFESQMCDGLETARQHLIDLKITQKLRFPLTYLLFFIFFLGLSKKSYLRQS